MKNVDTKKNFAKRITVLTILLITLCVGNAWGGQYVYDFSSVASTWYTNSTLTTTASTGSSNNYTTVYYKDGTTWTAGGTSHYFNSGYYLLGKSGAYLNLPTYTDEKITSIVIHSSSGHSTKVSVNITASGTSASTGLTWSTNSADYVYAINASYQASALRVQVTNANNTQFTRITINTVKNSSCAGTQLTTPNVSSTPSNGQIQLTWPAVTNATKYQVSWNGGSFVDATSPFTKASLTNGTAYTWAVRAVGNGSTYCTSEAFEGSTKPGSTVYTITWKVNGETYATTKVASGDHLMLPASPSSCEVGKVFAGWSATNIGSTPTDTKPTFVSSQTTASGNVTYHAVFATRTANSYTKGDINDLFPGQTTLIVNVSNNKALSDEYVTSYQDKRLQKVDVTISSSKITSMSNSHLIWTVANSGQKYNFTTGTGNLRATCTGNDKLSCKPGSDPWTLTAANAGTYYMNSNISGSSRLEYYSSYFTTYGTNGTGSAYEMSFFVPTYTQYFTSCASCSGDPTIGDPTIPTSFTLTSLTGAVSVNGSVSPGSNCTWEDMGLVWGASANPTTSNNKKVIGGSGSSISSFANNVQPSGSTTPTAWVVGTPYYVRIYGKNGADGAGYHYSTNDASFTLRSITYNSNGGTTVNPQYVNSGGTYSAPTAPTKTGYTFGGWYKEAGLNNVVDWENDAVSENKTYYAKWNTTVCTITLNQNGATTSSSPTSVNATYGSGSLSSAITNPEKMDYIFGGWYSGSGGTGSLVIGTDGTLQANVAGYTDASGNWAKDATSTTLYANWTEHTYTNYRTSCCPTKVTLVGSVPSGHGTVTFSPTGPVTTCDEDKEVTMTITPDAGYQLTAWSVTGTATPSSSTPAVVTNNNSSAAQVITLVFAEDSEGTYTANATFTQMQDKYYDYMHDNATQTKSGNYGTAPNLSSVAKGDGCSGEHYKFIGWIPEGDMNMETGVPTTTANMVAGGATGKYATNTNYYAIWAEEE